MRRHHPGLSLLTCAKFEHNQPIRRPDNKENGLQTANSAHVLQGYEFKTFAS